MSEKLVIGKTIKMPCMRRGLCKYDEPPKPEVVLLNQETLEDMAKTIHGIPVVIRHQDVDGGNVSDVVVGRVADMHYDQDTDYWLAHFVVDDAQAVDLLKNGWGVSTAYGIMGAGPGGTLNNVPYDREITKAKYLHLAIVEHPRYEMAKNPVFYNGKDLNTDADAAKVSNAQDSQNSGGKKMIAKLWKKLTEQIKLNEGDEVFVEVDGKEVALNSIMGELDEMTKKQNEAEEAKKKAEAEKENAKKHKMNGDDEVEYNGRKMTVNELVNCWQASKKKNEEKETEKEEKEEKKEKENSVEPPKVEEQPKVDPVVEKKEIDEATKRHNELLDATAKNAQVDDGSSFKTTHERMLEGQEKYGARK